MPPPPKTRPVTGLVALLGVLALLVFGGVGIGFYLLNDDDPKNEAGSTHHQHLRRSRAPAAAGRRAARRPAPAAPRPTPASPTKGKCLVNKGNAKKPVMEITTCAPRHVRGARPLRRHEGLRRQVRRGKVPGYEFYYFFDSDLDTLDFVLCLKKR